MSTAGARIRQPVGCVVRIETGVAVVLTDEGEVSASYGPQLLASVADDPARAPAPGDWVSLRHWPDRRVTLDRVLTEPRATVLPFRPRGAR